MKKTPPKAKKAKQPESLGHGSHWEALGLGESEALIAFLHRIVPHSLPVGSFSPPWPGSPFGELIQVELPQGSLCFASIQGVDAAEKRLALLSAFPVLSAFYQ